MIQLSITPNLSKSKSLINTYESTTLSEKTFKPFWDHMSSVVPDLISPNVLSLSGLFLSSYGLYIGVNYTGRFVTGVCTILMILNHGLILTAKKYAVRIKNLYRREYLLISIGENIGTLFGVMTVGIILGFSSIRVLNYIVQSVMLYMLFNKLRSKHSDNTTTGFNYTTPNEICVLVLVWKSMTGWSPIPMIVLHSRLFLVMLFIVYWSVYFHAVIYIATKRDMSTYIRTSFKSVNFTDILTQFKEGIDHDSKILLLCLFERYLNTFLTWYGVVSEWSITDLLFQGLGMVFLVVDIQVSKLFAKKLHSSFLIVFSLLTLNHHFPVFIMVLGYWLVSIYQYNTGNIFVPTINVYVTGTSENLTPEYLKQVSSLGTRLIVGVEKDGNTHLKYYSAVSEIIENPPVLITENFIDEHNIHIVATNENIPSKSYEIPAQMGMLKIINPQ